MKVTRPYDNTDIVVVKDICSKEDLYILKEHVKEYFATKHKIFTGEIKPHYNTLKHEKAVKEILSKTESLAHSVIKQEFTFMGESPRFTPFQNFVLRVEGESMTPHYDGVPGVDPALQPPNVGSVFYITDENDGFSGGETIYPDLGIAYKPVAGSMIMHPGRPEYLHGVLEVKSGHRVTMNLFAFRDNQHSLATLDESGQTPRVGEQTAKGYIWGEK